ncbi:hAT family dimerization protein [Ceratobasidium sp. AG-Ba]|nr:hAT family dimerization protein [Ceratobasidium sp. AG-Ba]
MPRQRKRQRYTYRGAIVYATRLFGESVAYTLHRTRCQSDSQPPTKKRKANGSRKGQKRSRTVNTSAHAAPASEDLDESAEDTIPDTVAHLALLDEDYTDERKISVDEIDEARQEHDERVVSEATAEGAQGVLTKAGKLARKLHHNPMLQAKFEKLIEAWNTDYECLLSHQELKTCVEMQTAESENDLRNLSLDNDQWNLLDQLVYVLQIFKEATDLFSQSEVPMVHEVVPIFVQMRQRLELAHDDTEHNLHPLIGAAAHSSLMVFFEVFRTFSLLFDLPFSSFKSDRERVYAMVRARFYSFNPLPSQANPEGLSTKSQTKDDWLLDRTSSKPSNPHSGSIETYLRSAPLLYEAIELAGGPLRYWQTQSSSNTYDSQVARFAINYLSAPASSVDVERAFSCGRLMINHLQH